MATDYVILLYGDEQAWEASTPEQKAAQFDVHGRFTELLEERGHTVTGGAELTHSRTARTHRGGTLITDGPYAETAEQLGGFYLVQSDNPDDLLELVAMLGDVVEIRAQVPQEQSE